MTQENIAITLPDDAAIITAQLTVITYVTNEGKQAYSIHTKGDANMTTFLGMTVVAQRQIEEWGKGG